jgi:hypothetical protein
MAFNAMQLDALENCILNQIPEYMRRANIDKAKLGDLLLELQKIVKEPGNVLYENFDDGVDLTRKGRTLWVRALRDHQYRVIVMPKERPASSTGGGGLIKEKARLINGQTKMNRIIEINKLIAAETKELIAASDASQKTKELIAAADANQKALANGTLKATPEEMMAPIFELLASGEMTYGEMRSRYG